MHNEATYKGGSRMKRVFSILLIAALFVSFISFSGGVRVNAMRDDDEIIGAFVVNLFTAVDQVARFQLPAGMAINDGVSEYIAGKIAERKITYDYTSSKLLDYEIKVELAETNDFGNNLISKRFYVVVSFHYENLESIDSGYGREIELLIKKDKEGGLTVVGVRVLGILDGYDTYLYEDVACAGAVDLSEMELVKERVEEYVREVETFFEKYNKSIANSINVVRRENDLTGLTETRASLSKNGIANYARDYCRSNSPPSGNPLYPYLDMGNSGGDCTNFVSHSLLAGGASQYNNGNLYTGWYCLSWSNRSSSWSYVTALRNYLTRSAATPGPYGRTNQYYVFDERNGYPYARGDLLQHGSSSSISTHSTVVTGMYQYYSYSPYYLGALVCGRTRAGQYNYQQKAETVLSPSAYRILIILTGNR